MPWVEIAESRAWQKPRCSLQDSLPVVRPARPRRLNALGREPRCSLQDNRLAASGHGDVAAGGCGRRHRDEFASSSSDNRGGRRAIFGGYRGPPLRTRDRFGVSVAGIRCASAPGIPVGCTPPGQAAAERVEKIGGNTGNLAGSMQLLNPEQIKIDE